MEESEVIDALDTAWIWVQDWVDCICPGNDDSAGRIVHFQRTFDLPSDHQAGPSVIHLSADTRYKLLVNGRRLALGPARGTSSIWYHDTIDIGPRLSSGLNTLDIYVLRFFPNAQAAVPFPRCRYPGLSLCGSVGVEDLTTGKEDEQWRARLDRRTKFPLGSFWDIFLDIFEEVDGSPDEDWVTPTPYGVKPLLGAYSPWSLQPREFPLPDETACPFKAVRHADSAIPVEKWHSFITGRSPLLLEAGTTHRIELEFEVHSTAYLGIAARRPERGGSSLKLTYSEAYERLPRTRKASPQKDDRTMREGHGLVGPSDSYVFRGKEGEHFTAEESYEPFFWKTFRFIVLEIKVADDPLELLRIDCRQTNYPMGVLAKWDTGDELQSKMWDVSIRTMRNCMFDGYYDCPFYEQLVYGEDSRSAMLFHYLLSGDDRLARHTIDSFASSLIPDGLLCGSFPSTSTQILPGFSLFWVMAVCDHMLFFNDPVFARRHLPIIDAIFTYFERHIEGSGLVGRFPKRYWSFIDWNKGWPGGAPPVRDDEPLSFFTMIYAFTLRRAATLLGQVGRRSLAEEYRNRAEHATEAIMEACFDGQYFTDSLACSSARTYSQVGQIWGALTCQDQLCKRGSKRILEAAFAPDTSMAICSYPMQHYAFRALALHDNLYESLYHSRWDPWRKMLAKNLTTWEEDDVNARSDCHQWSSLPIYEFLSEVAGLSPLKPGWKTVRFAPRMKVQKRLYAKVVLGRMGCAEVEWRPCEKNDPRWHGVEGGKEGATCVTLRLPRSLRVINRRSGRDVDCGTVSHVTYCLALRARSSEAAAEIFNLKPDTFLRP